MPKAPKAAKTDAEKKVGKRNGKASATLLPARAKSETFDHPHQLFAEGHFSAEVLMDCVNHGAPVVPDGHTDAAFMNSARDFGTFGYGNG